MEKEQLAEMLKTVLASTMSLSLKAQNYHWNVTGPNFGEYHDFFGEYYEALNGFIDLYGEHIRQLGVFAPGSLSRFSDLTKISDEVSVPSSKFMFVRIGSDNQVMISMLKELHSGASTAGDIGLVATLDDTIRFHSKMQWMIDSYTSV